MARDLRMHDQCAPERGYHFAVEPPRRQSQVEGEDQVRTSRNLLTPCCRADPILSRDRETIRRALNLPPATIMEYKSNNGITLCTRPRSGSTHAAPFLQTRCRTSPASVSTRLTARRCHDPARRPPAHPRVCICSNNLLGFSVHL